MAESETIKVDLQHDIQVNGQRFKAGRNVEVPKAQADDIKRMDYEHSKYLGSLNQRHKYIVDSGSIAAGGGAN